MGTYKFFGVWQEDLMELGDHLFVKSAHSVSAVIFPLLERFALLTCEVGAQRKLFFYKLNAQAQVNFV